MTCESGNKRVKCGNEYIRVANKKTILTQNQNDQCLEEDAYKEEIKYVVLNFG